MNVLSAYLRLRVNPLTRDYKGENMSFRDFNGRSEKCRPYTDGKSFRDRNSKPVRKTKIPEQIILPEKTVSKNIPPQPANQYQNHNNIPLSQSASRYNTPASQPVSRYINPTVQQPVSRYQSSIYIQQPAQSVRSVPVQPQQSQFLYYTQNSATQQTPPSSPQPAQPDQKPFIPVPPPQPQEKPDPSKFVEEYVPTPPPKMVKAKVPTIRKKVDKSNVDFGGFGGTFDDDPDQSTPIADIPVMNSIDDYKL